MSQLTPLLAQLKASGAERAVFAPNQEGYVVNGDQRRPLPGGPIRGAALVEAVSELLSQEDISALSSTRPRIVRHEHEGDSFVLEIMRQGAGVFLAVRLASRPARSLRETVRRHDVVEHALANAAGAVEASSVGRARDARAEVGRPQAGRDAAGRVDERSVQPALAEAARGAPEARRATVDQVLQLARQAAEEAARGVARSVAEQAVREAAEEAARRAVSEALRETGREPGRGAPGEERMTRAQPAGAQRRGPATIDALLREMIQRKASDLHLTAGSRPVFRVDGQVHFSGERPPLSSQDIQAMVDEIITPRAREDFGSLRDADFAYEIPKLARFRVNVFEDRNGTGAVLRQIPIEILSAEQLGLPKACLDLCWLTKGLVLVTGPTGSGK